MSKREFKSQARELFAGYRICNSFIIGIGTGVYNEFNIKTKEFNYFNHYGVGFKYRYLFGKNLPDKKFAVEPYLNINNAVSIMNNGRFVFYDVGVNFVYAKAPYFYFGTGVMQDFYSENVTAAVDWYYGFGLRF